VKLLFLIISVVLVFFGCGQEIPPGQVSGERPLVSGIEIGEVFRTEHSAARALIGTVQRPDRITLAARVDGRVGRFAVREGETVRPGDLLLILEENLSAARLQEAEAGMQQAQSRIAALRVRMELAEKTFERYSRLREGEAVTPQEMDQVRSELEGARQELAAAEAAGRQAAAGRSAARIGEGYTRITAPYTAMVVRKEVREGATVMPGSPLVTLDSRESWQVLAEVPESSLDRIRIGETLPVQVPAANLEITGEVVEILPSVDVRNRSFPVKLKVPEHPALRSGQYARVITSGAPEVLITVPAAAVVTRGQLTGVYVVQDGILLYRQVKTGEKVDERIEILSGLSGEEAIVVRGVENARNGARVEG
jgi:RND family efflux transporter MFP subunit